MIIMIGQHGPMVSKGSASQKSAQKDERKLQEERVQLRAADGKTLSPWPWLWHAAATICFGFGVSVW